jgi:hypothetical protein
MEGTLEDFKIDDKVEVINYGCLYSSLTTLNFKLINDKARWKVYDIYPELIGHQGIITNILISNGTTKYTVTMEDRTIMLEKDQLKII